MQFPITVNFLVNCHNEDFERTIVLRKGLTVLLGPNGSGKTHLLRGLKNHIGNHAEDKKVRFISAGRMGSLEHFRSDFDGHRGTYLNFDNANFGSKGDVQRRHNIETLNGDFQTLSQRADILVKVQERLRKLFQRDLIIDWDGGQLKVVFVKLDSDSDPYSSGREASGLLHLVGILSALYDDEIGVLLLDEPEVSLHPQLQSFLLNEIIEASGHPSEGRYKKLIIMATHSTEMLKISKAIDLCSLIFCHDLYQPPTQIDPEADELKGKKLQALISRLGQEHKLSLFCKKPLLVEGPSDVMLCSFISNKLGLYLEAAGSQILPVIGKGEMPIVSKFMSLLGKEPVVLADADAFTDNLDLTNYFLCSSIVANEKAADLGAASASNLAATVFRDFCSLVSTNWDDISNLAIEHPYWINKESDGELPKRRSAFCSLFENDESKIRDISNGSKWISIKKRIEVILSLLEISGCFILRKGPIESYYQSSDRLTAQGKPSAAVDEVDFLASKSNSDINSNFPEVVRCLEFASLGERINEAESLRDILLSIAAPAMARLGAGTTTQDLKIMSKSILRERADIFNINVSDGTLTIDINSNILNVNGFPVRAKRGDDIIKIINQLIS